MIIYMKQSKITGKNNHMEIPLSEEEFTTSYTKWIRGELIQKAFPTLSVDHREFIMNGITPEEWNEIFGGSEDEEK